MEVFTIVVQMNGKSCMFCGKESSPYTCPRCNGHYCSTECYKHEKHLRCSEDFYRDWVTVCSKGQVNSPETKKKMVEYLKKLNEQDEQALDSDDDDDALRALEDRMADVDLSGNIDESILLERLTDAEKEEFQNKIKSGEASNWIEIWEPWWQHEERIKLVEEITETSTVEPKRRKPLIKQDILLLSALTSKPPADCVKYNLLNVIAGYVLTVRFYNGDHFEFAAEAVKLLMELSRYLSDSRNFGSAGEAIHTAFQPEIQNGKDSILNPSCHKKLDVIEDLIKILNGPNERKPLDYVLAALTDTLNLVRSTRLGAPKTDKKKLTLVEKKLEYLLSWSVGNPNTIKEICRDVTLEKANVAENELSLRSASFKEDAKQVAKQNVNLIVELN